MKQHTTDGIKFILIILSVVAMGLLAVNQGMGFFYKSEFLQQPCELCLKLNPQFEDCFIENSIECKDLDGNIVDNSNCQGRIKFDEINFDDIIISP